MNRQKLILAILLVLLSGSVIWTFNRVPRQKEVARLTYEKGAAAVPRGVVSAPSDLQVRLDLLDQRATGFKGFRRNIFRPLFLQEADTVKRKLAKLPPPPPPLPPTPPPPPPPPPTPLQLLQTEMNRFIYLGFLQKENRKTVFLSRDNQIYLVKKGDKLLGKYEVSALTDKSFTVKAPQDGSELVVPLVENKPLAPVKK